MLQNDLDGGDLPLAGKLNGARPALTLHLPYREPLNWRGMLEFFRQRATPGVECVDGGAYRRTLEQDGRHLVLRAAPAEHPGTLELALQGAAPESLDEIAARARAVFDLDAPVADIDDKLGRDPALRRLMKREAGIRVPGAWSGFEITVRAILGQQVSVKGATTLAGRIAKRYGEPLAMAVRRPGDPLERMFPRPERLLRARFPGVGLVRSRAETIRRVAAAVLAGDLRFDAAQDPAEFCAALCRIRGIGEWTAQYVAMRALKHPDAWLATDLGLLKALRHPERMRPADLARRAERWRPWRAYAATLLWSSLPGSGG